MRPASSVVSEFRTALFDCSRSGIRRTVLDRWPFVLCCRSDILTASFAANQYWGRYQRSHWHRVELLLLQPELFLSAIGLDAKGRSASYSERFVRGHQRTACLPGGI